MTAIPADIADLIPPPPRPVQIFGETASLAAKLSLAQLAPMLASLCLAKLVAMHGADDFSAYSIVTSLNITCYITATGFLQSLYYVCGRALGRREPQTYAATLSAGLIWAAGLGIACTLISVLAGPAATAFGVAPVLRPQIAHLGLVAACGLLPTTLLMVLRVHATMKGGAGLVTGVYIGGGLLATVMAAALARFGAPGVLWGVTAANWLMLAAMLAGLRAPRLRLPSLSAGSSALRAALGTVFAMGWPTGAIIFLDSVASLVSVMIVARFWLPVTPLHAAVLLCISIGLVGPLGLSQVAIQRVSISNAEGDFATRDCSAWSVLGMAAVYGVIAAIVLGCLGGEIGQALIGPAVTAVPPALLRTIVILGGVVLGCQSVIVVAASALRGLGVAKAPLVQALIGYGVVAAGSELLFSLWLKGGAAGVWWGLVVGFASTAAALLLRCFKEFGPFQLPVASCQFAEGHSGN
jgi:MATE family multidrug resistance protein